MEKNNSNKKTEEDITKDFLVEDINLNEKIKEDAIKDYLIEDIKDQSKSLDQENWKNYIIFLILGFFIKSIFDLEHDSLTAFIYVLFMIIFTLSAYNFFSKKVLIYTNIENIFNNNISIETYEEWLNKKYRQLKNNSNNYKNLISSKVIINKINLFLLCIMLLLLVINKFI